MSEENPVLVEREGAVLIVRLNRPHAGNSISPELYAEVGKAMLRARDDDAIRVVIITAAGDRIFCAGMDLKAFAEGRRVGGDGPGFSIFQRQVYPKPIIAAVNGTAVAGGMELMLACDMVVCADHARFGLPEVKRALVAPTGGALLPRRLPLAVALEIGLTGEMFNAQRAYQLGLVNMVTPADQVMPEALKLANAIAANGPLALKLTKQLMYESQSPVDWQRIDEIVAPAFASEDAREGATAFAQKRAPVWKGR